MILAAFLCLAPVIHDGDNIRCAGRTMRLAGIDAPDFLSSPKCRRYHRGAWCDDRLAARARDQLRDAVSRAPTRCVVVDADRRTAAFDQADRYGRPVVRCSTGRVDLSRLELATGAARKWPAR